jgi:hypothetical protein
MWIWLILFWMTMPNLWAANPYRLGEVDYFHQQAENIQEEPAFDWRDASLSADGQAASYVPPGPVLTLLDNPSQSNARAYLNWQKQKIERIMKAQEAIDQVLKEDAS